MLSICSWKPPIMKAALHPLDPCGKPYNSLGTDALSLQEKQQQTGIGTNYHFFHIAIFGRKLMIFGRELTIFGIFGKSNFVIFGRNRIL